ncbi:unnamed protein product [Orchesella dallaii]|uniref:Uncharacterized protein n=1 Tax=Orchesella dallaii TaxID=48710 RepID=A0ABP1S886_9HEXA
MQNQMFLVNQESSILEKRQQLVDKVDAALPFGTDSARHGQRVFAAGKPPTNPPVTVKGEWRHPVLKRRETQSYNPRFFGSSSRLGAPQLLGHGGKNANSQPVQPSSKKVVPAVSGEEALANALLKVLSAQSKTTEKFVVRQSLESRLPVFSGNPFDWRLFQHHFRQSTEDCGFTPVHHGYVGE